MARKPLVALALVALIPSAFARSWHAEDWAAALAPPPPQAVVYVPQPVYVPSPQVIYVPVAPAPVYVERPVQAVPTFSWSYPMGGGKKGCSYSNGQQTVIDASELCPNSLMPPENTLTSSTPLNSSGQKVCSYADGGRWAIDPREICPRVLP